MAWYRCVGGAGGSLKLRTASGRIATFNTNMVEAFKSLKSDINPVQDLHGYSKPWSGGGGKNKYNATINSLYTSWDNGIYTITSLPSSGYSWRMDYVTLPAGNYILNGGVSTNYRCFIQLGSDYYTSTGNDAPFTLTEETEISVIGVIMPAATVGQKMKPMIRLASVSDASFEPYSNICPISGFSALNVTRTGKNKLNYDAWKTTGIARGTAVWENNGVKITATSNDAFTNWTVSGYPVNARVPISEGETITLSWEESTNKDGLVIIFPNGTTTGTVTVNNGAVKKATYTATSGVTFVTFRLGVANSGDTIAYKNIQIEKGSTATDFEPYNGQTYNIPFEQTVYGGSLNLTTGELTVTHGIVDLGSLAWAKISMGGGKYGFRATIPTMATTPASSVKINAICEAYEIKNGNAVYLGNVGLAGWGVGSHDIAVYDNTLESGSAVDFQTAMNGIMLVYELASPIEITTTPENLTAIVGENNVYGDTNGDTEVKYLYRE